LPILAKKVANRGKRERKKGVSQKRLENVWRASHRLDEERPKKIGGEGLEGRRATPKKIETLIGIRREVAE